MKSTETRLFVRSIAFRKLTKSGPLWEESSWDRRDSPTSNSVSHQRPVMTVIHEMTSWSMQRKQQWLDRYHMANAFTRQKAQSIPIPPWSSNSCISTRNVMPSLKGFQGDGRYIHTSVTPCFHMNRGEHLLMLYLYWICNLLVINSNSDHTATSTSSYLGCKSISYHFF